MSKIIRHEFMGSWITFWILCVLPILIPAAVIYLVNGTITIEEDIEDPEKFIKQFRSGKFGKT